MLQFLANTGCLHSAVSRWRWPVSLKVSLSTNIMTVISSMTVSSACGSDDWGHSLLEKDFIPQECDTFIYDQFFALWLLRSL